MAPIFHYEKTYFEKSAVLTSMNFELSEARRALTQVFGFDDFRPGQREILEAIFSSEDVLAVMPTGAGKSLLYQLPAVVRGGMTIVVSPLIALMRDQVRQLQARGISAAALNSANSGEDNATIEAGLRGRRYRLLYITPERLARANSPDLMRESGANVFAIDEAHCISQWGHDFRPEYLGLAEAARTIGKVQIIAVTATADLPTRNDIVDKLFHAKPRIFVESFDRPNLHLAVLRKTDPFQQIETMVDNHRGQSGIIYCASRQLTERLSHYLGGRGIPALPYHAGLVAAVRSAYQDEFASHDGVVIIATNAFGMGIDKPSVRFVCHADLPQSIETYYQEIGRAGRDGLAADTLLLFSDSDILLRERQMDQSVLPDERRRIEKRKLKALVSLCETLRCRRQTLLAAFGEKAEPCGNCDICDGEGWFPKTKLFGQKIFSTIHRSYGRLSDGRFAGLIFERRADRLWEHVPSLLPLPSASEILHDLAPADNFIERQRLRPSSGQDPQEPLSARQNMLFSLLKVKRRELAKAHKRPAYRIFPDEVLMEMARRQPKSDEEMRALPGIEPKEIDRYGSAFLQIIEENNSKT